jgi:hypothetical protein
VDIILWVRSGPEKKVVEARFTRKRELIHDEDSITHVHGMAPWLVQTLLRATSTFFLGHGPAMRNEPSSSEAIKEVISLVTLQLIAFGYRFTPMTKQQALAMLQVTSRFGVIQAGPPTTSHASEKIDCVYFITTHMVFAWCRRALQYQTTTNSMGPTNYFGGWSDDDDHSDTGNTISYKYNEVDTFYNAVVASVDNEVPAEDSEDNIMLDNANDIIIAVVNDILASLASE